jgi:hypothetical protein
MFLTVSGPITSAIALERSPGCAMLCGVVTCRDVFGLPQLRHLPRLKTK